MQKATHRKICKEAGYSKDQADYILRKMEESGIADYAALGELRGRIAGTEAAVLAIYLTAARESLEAKQKAAKAADSED